MCVCVSLYTHRHRTVYVHVSHNQESVLPLVPVGGGGGGPIWLADVSLVAAAVKTSPTRASLRPPADVLSPTEDN